MRCNDCSKFVSYELGSPEVSSVEMDGDGGVKAEVRLTLDCAECGAELKEHTFEITKQLTEEQLASLVNHCGEKSVEENGDEEAEETGGKKPAYLVRLTCKITCEGCDADVVEDIQLESDACLSAEFEEV